jgi:hypothetical protein
LLVSLEDASKVPALSMVPSLRDYIATELTANVFSELEDTLQRRVKELKKVSAERDDLKRETTTNNERFAAATQRILDSTDSHAIMYPFYIA